MKYTGDNYTPHFGGLWAPVGDAEDYGGRQLALLFLGECYLVFFEYIPAKREFNYSSQSYVLEGNQLLMMPMTPGEEPKDDEMQILYWDITDDKLLEIEQDGKTTLWEPVLVETLAEEGFPVAAIEGYRKAYEQNGFKYSVVGYAPLPSTMDAIRKLKQEKE